MAKKSKTAPFQVLDKKFTTPRGVAVYPHLHAPDYEFDSAGVFSTKLRLDTSRPEVQKWMKRVKRLYKEYAKEHGLKVKKSGLPWTEDSENEGSILVNCKMKHQVSPRNSEPFTQVPVIVDAKRTKLDETPAIGGGSELKLAGQLNGYGGFGGGVSIRLKAVQVLELVEWEQDFGFDEEDGFATDGDDDPFGPPVDDDEDEDDEDDDDEEFGDDDEDGDDDYDEADF